MADIAEKYISTYVNEERARCAALAKKVRGDLLIFCIEHAYTVEELDTARQRFAEQPDSAEDLM